MSDLGASPLSDSSVVALVGPYGTGKTEIAINYSLASVAAGRETYLADLDVVTPYFRVGDHRGELEVEGVRVIAAPGALASFETPALPAEIAGILGAGTRSHIVLDVGGDPAGARLLGVYAPHVASRSYDLWMVVNPFRPASSSAEALADQRKLIEAASGLRVSGLVANPHLGRETESHHIASGWLRVRRMAEEMELPIAFLAVDERLLGYAPAAEAPLLGLRLRVRLPWESGAGPA